MRFSLVPFFLLVIPILEIAAFILIGQRIGVFAVLGLVFLTAGLGSILLRVQGMGILQRLTTESQAGRVPARELVHGGMIFVAGILLITPGFVTDSLGFLLFVPAFRDVAWSFIKGRFTAVHVGGANFGSGFDTRDSEPAFKDGVVDLDPSDFSREPDPNSPWADDNHPTTGNDHKPL